MANNSNVMWGFLGGLAAGVVGAILLAPRSGKETMDEINSASRKWTGQLNDQWMRMMTFGRRDLESLQRRQDQFVEEAREELQDLPHRPRRDDDMAH